MEKHQDSITIPADVPKTEYANYVQNYEKITENGKLFLFAADQKIEHLNDDFVGTKLPDEVADPEHLFRIASEGEVGAFATQLGLIARYGKDYSSIHYIVKLNSKTNLIPTKNLEPNSSILWDVQDVVTLAQDSKLNICGIGYTIYLGSQYESEMLTQAAQFVLQAHQNGLVAILWIYPRGKNVKNELDAHIIAGAAGVGACLGADFVKIQAPQNSSGKTDASLLTKAVKAAGRTKVICAGGTLTDEEQFLTELQKQIEIGKVSGCAIGRNIFQKPLKNAITFTKKIYKIVCK